MGEDLPRPEWCQDTPPDQPNVYSDGGVINPTPQSGRLAPSGFIGLIGITQNSHKERAIMPTPKLAMKALSCGELLLDKGARPLGPS